MKKIKFRKKLYRLLPIAKFSSFFGFKEFGFFLLILGLAISKGILIVENGQEGKRRDTVKK
jgi:hypothetical protein